MHALFCLQHYGPCAMFQTCMVSPQIGYLSSWSAYATYRQKHPDREDPLTSFKKELEAALPQGKEGQEFLVEWPIFMLLAKRR